MQEWLQFQYRKRYVCTCKAEVPASVKDKIEFQYRKRYVCTCKNDGMFDLFADMVFQYRKRYVCTCKRMSLMRRSGLASFNTASGMYVHVRLSPAALENTGLRNGFLRLPAFGADFVK